MVTALPEQLNHDVAPRRRTDVNAFMHRLARDFAEPHVAIGHGSSRVSRTIRETGLQLAIANYDIQKIVRVPM